MSSTSNAQDLLVNVFRPTYRWDSNTGFTPSLVVSNVTEVITDSIITGKLAVSDSNANTYIGCNAGPPPANLTTRENTAIGYGAMSGASNSSNNVSIGTSNFDGLANSISNVGIGAETYITGSGQKNILLGANLTLGDGSGNILIGTDLSVGSVSNRFQLGRILYGNLAAGYVGVNTSAPEAPLDISGEVLFRNKVGIQKANPDYTLDVNGSVYATENYLGGRGTAAAPLFTFKDVSGTGLYQPTDTSYGLGALGLTVNGGVRGVVMSNKTVLYGGLDVCGTVTSSGGSASFLAAAGTASEPAYSFTGASNLGLYRTTDASGAAIGIAIGGQNRLVVGTGKMTMFGNLDVCGTFTATSGGGGGGGTVASNGTAAAPSFTFSNDASSGVYLQSVSNLGFATAGVNRMSILNTGDVSAGRLVVSTYLRNTTSGTRTLDISGGNISNSGTTTSSNFIGTASASNQIGGVTLSNGALSNATSSSNSIGGVTLSNTNISYAGTITGSTANTNNLIGGVTLSNNAVTTATNAANSIGGVTLTNGVANGTFSNTSTTNNFIGGVRVWDGAVIASNGYVLANAGNEELPAFTFSNAEGTGLYQAQDASYGTGALAIAVNQSPRIVVMSNKTFIYGNLDVCGTFNAASGGGGGGGGGGTVATDGTISAPSFTFSNDSTTGLYLPSTGLLGLTAGGAGGLLLTSNGYLGVAGATPDAFTSLTVGNDYSPGMSVTAANGNVQLMLCNATNSGSSGSKLLFVADNTGNEIRYTGVGGLAIMGSQYPKAAFGNDGTLTINPGSGYAADATRLDVYGNLNLQGTGGGSLTYSGAITGSTSGASNSIGGVTLSNGWISNDFTTENTIGGVTLSSGILSNSSSSVNTIGGVWLSNGVFSNSSSSVNTIGGVWLSNGVFSNSSGTSNSIGGVTLNSGTIVNASNTNNSIGGVSLDYGVITSSFGTNSIGGVLLDSGGVFASSSINTIGATYITDVGIGIGSTPSTNQLFLTADSAVKSTTNTWTTFSDRRIKQNIQRADTSLCYDVIKRLPLQRFTWDASYMPTAVDRNSIGWIAQDVSDVFPNAVNRTSNAWFPDFHTLNVDQLYKTMYGALEQVIADKEALEAQVAAQGTLLQTILARLATLEASQQSSESTQTTPPTPPPPSESPESSPEPPQPPSSEYAPAPAETEA